MNIQATINTLLANTEEIRKNYPTVTNVRHVVIDLPYTHLHEFARQHGDMIRTDFSQNRVYVIHTPCVNGKIDSDFWLYSGIVKIKPAEITEL